MALPFKTSRLVEFADTDMAGIMHFSAFFDKMESAEHELIRSLGLSVFSTINGQNVSFPRVCASCDFHSPVKCEEMLNIEVRVERVGEKSITYEFRFSHNGRDVATGKMTSVCCLIKHGNPPKSIPIPEEVQAKLKAMVAG